MIVGQSDEIYGMTPIDWEDSSWTHSSLVGDEEVISLLHTSLLLRFCVMPWNVDHNQILHGKTDCRGSKVLSEYRASDRVGREPIEFEWNTVPGFTTLQLWNEVQELMKKWPKKPEYFPGQIIFMSMVQRHFMEISRQWGAMRVERQPRVYYARRFSPGRWWFSGPGSEKKC